MNFNTIDDPSFLALKAELEGIPRSNGYYLIDLVSVYELRVGGSSEEEILEQVFQHFDDHEWPPVDQRPADQTWNDYSVSADLAAACVVESLAGPYGDSISTHRANSLWREFEALFPPPRKYFIGMGFGDPMMAFNLGAAILSYDRAGLIFVVESD